MTAHQVFHRNPQELAQFMVDLVDESPIRTGVLEIPASLLRDDEDADAVEEFVRRAFDLAKATRPNLGVKISSPAPNATPGTGLAVIVHDHQFVGGLCVNGCKDTRDVPGPADS